MYSDTSKLLVWQKAHELVLAVYEVTKQFPKEELFALTNQIYACLMLLIQNR